MDDIRNCSLKVGGYVGYGPDKNAPNTTEAAPTVIPNPILSVEKDGNLRIVVRFAAHTVGNSGAANWMSADNPIVASLANVEPQYAVSDIQFVANVVEAPADYVATMVNQAASGKLQIQFNSYQNNRINITTGSISNEIFIPTDLQRCYCILAVNEELRAHSIFRSDFKPSNENLFNYQWILDGTNTPNIPVSLTRLATDKVSPLQIIELEKALEESSIPVKNIQNPSDFAVLGRRLGAYGDAVSLLDKIVKCRINYSPSQNKTNVIKI